MYHQAPHSLNPATRQFICDHLADNPQHLALHHKPAPHSDLHLPTALTQIAARQVIQHKIPSWYPNDDLLYPDSLPLQQASSEAASRYKATLLSGHSFADLTGGLGVDTAFIAPQFTEAHYVERQAPLIALARHNFPHLGLPHIQVHQDDAQRFLQTTPPLDCLYLDPARRAPNGKKIIQIADCEPNIIPLQAQLLSIAPRVLIKLSPMLDLSAAQKTLHNILQIHILSIDNECKELLFLLQKDFFEEPTITCTHLIHNTQHSDTFTLSEEKTASPAPLSTPLAFLYEPNPSLLKSGLLNILAHRYGISKLHPNSHLYTSPQALPHFPGRIFHIDSVFSFNKKALQIALHDTPCAHLATRNFPLSALALRRQLKLKDGGDTYLFATTLADGKRVLIKTHK